MSPEIATIEAITNIIASCVSSIALIIGGLFAWHRWGREAPTARRGELHHEVIHTLLSESHRLVHLTLSIKNVGTATLRPVEAYTKVFQVLPLEGDFGKKLLQGTAPLDVTDTMYLWPAIARVNYPTTKDELRIDSGECQKYDADFIIPAAVQAAFVYSMACLDPADADLGWDVTSFHPFSSAK